MIKYAKITNEETGLCEVGLGANVEFYKSIGMVELDVEQSEVDGSWYLADKCPKFSDDEKAQQRKAQFYNIFFEIPNFGCYRKVPKGYGSAVESMNTAFNIVTVLGQLPSNTLTFYTKPDFTIEEQCTEEWLIANSFKNKEMTASEFGAFYAQFMTAWNNQEHIESLLVEVE